MLRYGKISELGTGEWLGYARVHFEEIDIVSYWLPLPSQGVNGIKHWVSIPVNTQVAVLKHEDGEQHVIVGAIWNDKTPPPNWANENSYGIEFPDGTKIYYNSDDSQISVSLCIGGKLVINAKNQALDAILQVINNPDPILETGNGAPSVMQQKLQLALTGKDETIWERLI